MLLSLSQDVSGFTAMSESLSKRGGSGEGAELVRNVLSSYLSALLEVVDQFRGDVIKVSEEKRKIEKTAFPFLSSSSVCGRRAPCGLL
jgi:hypothetical protein